MSLEKLWIPAALLMATLPVVSTALMSATRGVIVVRWLRAMLSYLIVFCLIFVGYVYQTVTSLSTQGGYFYSFRDNSWLQQLGAAVAALFELKMLAVLVINASIIGCVLLIGRSARERATGSFRAAFITFTAIDLFIGVERGYGGFEYLECIVFNFVGALLLGVFASFIVERVYPAANNRRARAVAR